MSISPAYLSYLADKLETFIQVVTLPGTVLDRTRIETVVIQNLTDGSMIAKSVIEFYGNLEMQQLGYTQLLPEYRYYITV